MDVHANLSDTVGVGRVFKKILAEAGFLDLDHENDNWTPTDESAWKSYCDREGGRYTPFPEIANQPPHIVEAFNKHAQSTQFKPFEGVQPRKDFAHLMVDSPARDKEGNISENQPEPRTRNNPDEVNWGIHEGAMQRFSEMKDQKKVGTKMPTQQTNPPRQVKLQAQITSRDKDGKKIEPDKDLIDRVNNPTFDPSHPQHNSQTDAAIDAAPEHTEPHEPKIVPVDGIDTKKKSDPKLTVR